jgi:hypothetical protein
MIKSGSQQLIQLGGCCCCLLLLLLLPDPIYNRELDIAAAEQNLLPANK